MPRAERAEEDAPRLARRGRRSKAPDVDRVRKDFHSLRAALPGVDGQGPADRDDQVRPGEDRPLEPAGLCGTGERPVPRGLGGKRSVQLDNVRDRQPVGHDRARRRVEREPLVERLGPEHAQARLEPVGEHGVRRVRRRQLDRHVRGQRFPTGRDRPRQEQHLGAAAGERGDDLGHVDRSALDASEGNAAIGAEVGDSHATASSNSVLSRATFSASE